VVCIELLATFWPQMSAKSLIEDHFKIAEAIAAKDKRQAPETESKVVKKAKIRGVEC